MHAQLDGWYEDNFYKRKTIIIEVQLIHIKFRLTLMLRPGCKQMFSRTELESKNFSEILIDWEKAQLVKLL